MDIPNILTLNNKGLGPYQVLISTVLCELPGPAKFWQAIRLIVTYSYLKTKKKESRPVIQFQGRHVHTVDVQVCQNTGKYVSTA